MNMPVALIGNSSHWTARKVFKYLVKMFLTLLHELSNQTSRRSWMLVPQPGTSFVDGNPSGVQLEHTGLYLKAQHELPITKRAPIEDICINKYTLSHTQDAQGSCVRTEVWMCAESRS